VVDLPLEESTALQRACALNGLDLVLLVSPSTPPARARKIAEASRGFVYLVSSVGVTGAKKKVSRQALRLIRRVKKTCKGKPLCVGFGVSNAGQAATLARAGADGVIVGSALIDKVGEKNFSASLARVRALAASISGGLKHV